MACTQPGFAQPPPPSPAPAPRTCFLSHPFIFKCPPGSQHPGIYGLIVYCEQGDWVSSSVACDGNSCLSRRLGPPAASEGPAHPQPPHAPHCLGAEPAYSAQEQGIKTRKQEKQQCRLFLGLTVWVTVLSPVKVHLTAAPSEWMRGSRLQEAWPGSGCKGQGLWEAIPSPLVCSILHHVACSSPVSSPGVRALGPASGLAPLPPGGAPVLSSAPGMSFLKTPSAAGLPPCVPRLCAGAEAQISPGTQSPQGSGPAGQLRQGHSGAGGAGRGQGWGRS